MCGISARRLGVTSCIKISALVPFWPRGKGVNQILCELMPRLRNKLAFFLTSSFSFYVCIPDDESHGGLEMLYAFDPVAVVDLRTNFSKWYLWLKNSSPSLCYQLTQPMSLSSFLLPFHLVMQTVRRFRGRQMLTTKYLNGWRLLAKKKSIGQVYLLGNLL